MNYDHYKAASERTDADERALIPGFKRIRPQAHDEHDCRNCGEHFSTCICETETDERNEDLRQESRETEEREASGYWDRNEGDQ